MNTISNTTMKSPNGLRGLEFRLHNVLINRVLSRSQTLARVVGDPRIATTQADTVERMKKLNLFCKLVDLCHSQHQI